MIYIARRPVAVLLVPVRQYLPQIVREVARQGTDARTLVAGSDPVAPIEIGIRFQLVGGDDIGDLGEKCLSCRGVGCAEFTATDETARSDVSITADLDHRRFAVFGRTMNPS